MKNYLLFSLSLIVYNTLFAQSPVDSLQTLGEVRVRAFEQNRDLYSGTTNIRIIDAVSGDRYNKMSLVNGLNSIAGVRMEERSPGSYRLNMRGSSLRSPFGVRNVKVYWNDMPVTDPSGNTYFNQFAYNNFSGIEIFKGPSSSLYGAGTGGLILINNFDQWKPGVSVDYVTGSYNLQNILTSARFGNGDNRNQVTYAHNKSDGYRVQSEMQRDNISWQSQLKLSDKQQLSASLLYTDLYYQTPGALTAAEFATDPKAARPAGGGFPSAVNALAAIYQKTLTAGFTSRYQISPSFEHVITLYGAYAQVKNSAIRNYERRNEPQFGGRTTLGYTKTIHQSVLKLTAGAEVQQGYFNTQVANNRGGRPDTIQTNDDIDNRAVVVFTQGDLVLKNDWYLTAGVSFNKTIITLKRLSRYPVLEQKTSFNNEVAPRVAIMKKITDDFHVLGSIARGFSPPTVAELLPSTGVISTELEAESGWNYEATVRYLLFNKSLRLEATGFYFDLNDALVQRRDLSGADFFTNAGNVKQKGLELQADYTYYPAVRKVIDNLKVTSAFTYNHFRYGSFVKGTDDFSGKTIPSVPAKTFSTLADLQFSNGAYVGLTYYAASKIYLNDANTAVAEAYHLLGARVGWKKTFSSIRLNLYGGADNLLDETYSLGNDINAAANRFYNAAPRRNYYVGIGFNWVKGDSGKK
ncbi:MAG: TonB-dependent receptor plug domain-containing protein [Chitinophagaceae bacterium]